MTNSIYWYDYETFGTDPRFDRLAQFAGLRTDEELNIIDQPLTLYCKPADDMLPDPAACMVTGITPQKALAEGLIEADFIAAVHAEFAKPGTCVAGYNNIRFDDEFTRFTLYRNFYNAYSHEWQNGNSRWDIIDMVRLTRALRPEGIEWPVDDEGRPSNRLELLTTANGISHEAAHDAMSDVYATIAVARLIRDRQPRLYDYVYGHRKKDAAGRLLNLRTLDAVLHVSAGVPPPGEQERHHRLRPELRSAAIHRLRCGRDRGQPVHTGQRAARGRITRAAKDRTPEQMPGRGAAQNHG